MCEPKVVIMFVLHLLISMQRAVHRFKFMQNFYWSLIHACRCTLNVVIVLCNSNHWPHSSSCMQSVCKNRRPQAAPNSAFLHHFLVRRFIFGTSAQMRAYFIAIYSLSLQTNRLTLAVSCNWTDFRPPSSCVQSICLPACMHCLGNPCWRGHICKQYRFNWRDLSC